MQMKDEEEELGDLPEEFVGQCLLSFLRDSVR